jgi:septal ring factor EnvC (AmiA/AmiB activator)
MADGSAKVEDVRREVASLKVHLSDRCSKLNRNLTNLERELMKLKEEMRAMRANAAKSIDAAAEQHRAVARDWWSVGGDCTERGGAEGRLVEY